MNVKTATFAAGCFWGVEANFRKLKGVSDTIVGFTGGSFTNPSYKLVCTDTTGHAEAVRVTFDQDQISYEELLNAFWEMHDPTTPDQQGPNYGSQYRSAIFYHDEEQKQAAERSKQRLAETGSFRYRIVTEIIPVVAFYEAEEWHQRYYEKHGFLHC